MVVGLFHLPWWHIGLLSLEQSPLADYVFLVNVQHAAAYAFHDF